MLRVKSVNEDGTFVCEWADGGLQASLSVSWGIDTNPQGILTLRATNTISGLTERRDRGGANDFQAVTTATYDQAVKHALCDAGTATGDTLGKPLIWTAEEQAAAQQRLGLNKEWVLKGTLTTENKDAGVTVDLIGCTEMILFAYANGTGASNLVSNSGGLVYGISRSGARTTYAHYVNGYLGMECINGVYINGRNANEMSTRQECYSRFDGKQVPDITTIYFNVPSAITECNIEIYAR